MRIKRVISDENFFDSVQLGGSCRGSFDIFAGDEGMNVLTKGLGGRERLGGRLVKRPGRELGEEQHRHQITPASSLSRATSSAAEPILIPAFRAGGALVFKSLSRGVIST